MKDFETILYNALNVTNITSLLDAYLTGKALFIDNLIPESFTGDKSINCYQLQSYSGALDYPTSYYTASCRAKTRKESLQIAHAVFAEMNRSNNNEVFYICNINPTIQPENDTDNYNTPVEIIIKQR